MRQLIITALTVASGLLFGQLQNSGAESSDKERGEKALSPVAQLISRSERVFQQNRLAITISLVALLVSLIALIRSFWR